MSKGGLQRENIYPTADRLRDKGMPQLVGMKVNVHPSTPAPLPVADGITAQWAILAVAREQPILRLITAESLD